MFWTCVALVLFAIVCMWIGCWDWVILLRELRKSRPDDGSLTVLEEDLRKLSWRKIGLGVLVVVVIGALVALDQWISFSLLKL